MSLQDWQIRVHLRAAKQLLGMGLNGKSNPVAFATFNHRTQHTVTHYQTDKCVWDHFMLFEVTMDDEHMADQYIKIEVRHEGDTPEEDCMIGVFEILASKVYQSKGHEIFNQWVGLINTENSTILGCSGYLLYSCGIFGPGDIPPRHRDHELPDLSIEQENELSAMIPETITQQYFKLNIKISRCLNLPKVDALSSCDTFASVKFGNNPPISTKTHKHNLEPEINENLIIPVTEPSMCRNICVMVEDYNSVSTNVEIGHVMIDWLAVKEHGEEGIPFRFYHMYGPPPWKPVGANDDDPHLIASVGDGQRFVGQDKHKPKRRKDVPSTYRGTIFASLSASETVKPARLGSKRLPIVQMPKTVRYVIWCDIYEASQLCSSDKYMQECQIELTIGAFSTLSSAEVIHNKSVGFYGTGTFQDIEIELTEDVTQIPDLIINVYAVTKIQATNTRLGFIRIPAVDLIHRNFECTPEWFTLTPDEKIDMFSVVGFLLMGIGFGRIEACYDETLLAQGIRKSKFTRQNVRSPPSRDYQLRVHVYQAKGLVRVHENFMVDAYVVARCGGVSGSTTVKGRSLAPIFNESIVLDVDLPSPITQAPDVQIMVMDKDNIDDEMLGTVNLPLARVNSRLVEHPTWVNLKPSGSGKILCSMQLVSRDDVNRIRLVSIIPEMKECVFEINVVGVRNLLPFQMSEIEQPYLEFDLGDQSDKSKVKRTAFSSRPNGANANFLETISLPARLPVDPRYAPTLNVSLYETYGIDGDRSNLIGNAQINIAPYLPWANVENPEDDEDDEDNSDDEDMEVHIFADEDDAIGDDLPENIEEWNEMSRRPYTFNKSHGRRRRKKTQRAGEGDRTIETTKVSEYLFDDDDEEDEEEIELDKVHEDELENHLKDVPFETNLIYRGVGKSKTAVGLFKANVRVIEIARRSSYPPINLKQIFAPKPIVIRIYCLKARGLPPTNPDGSTDSYLSVRIGEGGEGKQDDSRNDFHEDTANPPYYHVFELTSQIPGESEVTISAVSKDRFGENDEVIGSSTIDMENRFLSDEWANIKPRPKETRTLYRPGSKETQGKLEMWIDILTAQEALAIPKTVLVVPVPDKWQLRVVIYSVHMVPRHEYGSDLFVSAKPAGKKMNATDIHPRVERQANFNWRLTWEFILPEKHSSLMTFQLWNKLHLSANDAVGEVVIDLNRLFKRAYAKKSKQKISRQELTMTHPTSEGPCGKLDFEIQIVPWEEALDRPVGVGRAKPNESPYLKEPARQSIFDKFLVKAGVDKLPNAAKYRFRIISLTIFIILMVLLEKLRALG